VGQISLQINNWAIAAGIAYGGWCPKGRRAEDGEIPSTYVLKETLGSGYLQRTEWNVRDSDATLIFTLDDELSGGSGRTAKFADAHGKPWLHVRPSVHPRYVARFWHVIGPRSQYAGTRGSAASGIAELVHRFCPLPFGSITFPKFNLC
jgi:hypothetical protein